MSKFTRFLGGPNRLKNLRAGDQIQFWGLGMYGQQADGQGTFVDDLLQLCHEKERSFCAQCYVESAQNPSAHEQ